MALDTAARMERMYRHQTGIYDLSRKFYLLGRDRLIDGLPLRPGDHLAEIGCGTGRNLVRIARRHPDVQLYGLDASRSMLAVARRNVVRAGVSNRIRLAHGLGEELEPGAAFGLDRPFDAVVISYALTMIPSWPDVVQTAVAHLRPGGTLAVVDFWDQRGLPAWFRRALLAWLALFDVRPNSQMPDDLRKLIEPRGGRVTIATVFRGYAFNLVYTAPSTE